MQPLFYKIYNVKRELPDILIVVCTPSRLLCDSDNNATALALVFWTDTTKNNKHNK